MADKKILVVFGATGLQGGSVVRYFLSKPTSPYHVRAVSRNPESEKAQALATAGAEVVRGDLDDVASLEAAIKGAHAVYLVTDFFSNVADPTNEEKQGKRAIDILAKSPTLEHLIWSSLPSVSDASKGKYTAVIHFDGKHEVTKYIPREHPELWAKTTVYWVGPYMQLWLQMPALFGPRKVVSDGEEVFALAYNSSPQTVLPWVDVKADNAKAVNAILTSGSKVFKKTVCLVGGYQTTREQALETWGEILGKKVISKEISDEDMAKQLEPLGFPEYLKTDILQVLPAMEQFGKAIFLPEGVVSAVDILPEDEKLTTWEEYVKSENWEPLLAA